ncbi:MAG: hypothetical protein HY245_01325 [Rhizobiales bacterium]|nr:hypothetical protein [Hyphomicrobiales bacterium]MBI3672071.1 hypothetical protein [Hyphomicrobiales bacterium]
MLKLLSVLLVGALAFGLVHLDPAPASAAPAFAAQSSDIAGVRVVVTPMILEPGVTIWKFEVAMDTHTKPLDEDIAQAAVLVDEVGRRYRPMAWQGDPPGGHHRQGILQFAAPADMPKAVELQIDGVGEAGIRTFRWALK